MSKASANHWFGLYIKLRDGLTCQYCLDPFPIQMLDCSHLFPGRGNGGLLDPDNAVAGCRPCHKAYEHNRPMHRDFALKRLGEERYWAMVRRVKAPMKYLDFDEKAREFREKAKAFPDFPGKRMALDVGRSC